MRILIISWEYPPLIIGGISPHVKAISTQLVKLGVSTTVITRSIDNQLLKEELNGVELIRTPTKLTEPTDFLNQMLESNFSYLNSALNQVKKINYDLIHIHDWMTFHAGYILKNYLNIPLISTFHSSEYGRSGGIHNDINRFIHSIEQKMLYESDKVIVCSTFMQEEAQHLFRTPGSKIKIIPNGIDIKETFLSESDIQKTRNTYLKNKKYLITFIGRLVHQKGVDILIDSIIKIKNEIPELMLTIVGSGYMKEELLYRVNESGIEDMVNFTGFISNEEKESLIEASDLLIYPSRYEPFGIVALEALERKKPVIVSDIGGFREIVTDKVTGIRAPLNPEGLAESIKFLLFNPALAKELGNNGRKSVIENFNWSKITLDLLESYEEVTKNKKQ